MKTTPRLHTVFRAAMLVAAVVLLPAFARAQGAIEAWVQRYGGALDGYSAGGAIAVDATGNACVTGTTSEQCATIKYSGEGVPAWTNRYNGTGNDSDEAKAVAVDASGNVIVTGWSVGSGSSCDYLTIKYSSAGMPLWTNHHNGPGGFQGPGKGVDRASALALDEAGNVIVTGSSEDASGMYWDYATVAYSSAGMPLWTNRYNGPGNDRDEPAAVAVDPSGNAYVTGFSVGSGSGDYWARSAMTTIKYVLPPIITRQPLSCTNAVGTTGNFTVEVAGGTPFGFQWRKDGADLMDGGNVSGVATPNLVIADVQLADAGGYSVMVTNAYGTATSLVAQLTVVVPPSGGQLTDFSYSPTTGFSFIFRDGTVGQSYRIQRSPSPAEGSWTDWQSFMYTEPNFFTDLGALTATNRFYRAISP